MLLKERLVAFIRQRSLLARLIAVSRWIPKPAEMFEPSALTIGFARRVAGYKRWNLLLERPGAIAANNQ